MGPNGLTEGMFTVLAKVLTARASRRTEQLLLSA